MSIKKNLQDIKNTLNDSVILVAVSKTKPIAYLQEAYDAGQRIFGENKVQEMTQKWGEMPKDIQWHMIGHLQTNKVKYMAPYVSLVHSVDSFKLLKEINKQALKNNRTIDCLLQIHIAEEETKFGLNESELFELVNSSDFQKLKNINVCGLMGMATFTDNQEQLKREFSSLKQLFDTFKNKYNSETIKAEILSMGMSGDYQLAISQGSNMVRVGSSIFGTRN